jgi:hypothetical protein
MSFSTFFPFSTKELGNFCFPKFGYFCGKVSHIFYSTKLETLVIFMSICILNMKFPKYLRANFVLRELMICISMLLVC